MNETNSGNVAQSPPSSPFFKRESLHKIILGVLVFIAIAIVAGLLLTHQTISSTVINQLDAIKKGNIVEAYNMNSTGFKAATSYEVFESYINSNPILNDFKKVTFSENTTTDQTGYLKGVIEGTANGQMSAEYQLVKEDGKWKIEAIRLSPLGTKTGKETMQTTQKDTIAQTPTIHGIMISDVADPDGYVEETKATLSRSAPKIYATVMLVSPKPDIKISTTLKHIPTGVILGPVESMTTKTGNIMKAFSFTREKQLWPTGEYEIDIQLSSGDHQKINFQIE